MKDHFLINVNIKYNSLIVIQSLRPNDRPTGEEIYNDIISRYTYLHKTISYFKTVDDKAGLNNLLLDLVYAVKKGNHLPIIHLEIHGGDQGLELSNGEIMTWLELATYLREINILIKNKLLITLAVCKGIMLYQAVDFNLPTPFWGIVAPKKNIDEVTLIEDFSEFYIRLLRDKNMQDAIDVLNRTKMGYTYALLTSETMLQLLEEMAETQGIVIKNIENMKKIFLISQITK